MIVRARARRASHVWWAFSGLPWTLPHPLKVSRKVKLYERFAYSLGSVGNAVNVSQHIKIISKGPSFVNLLYVFAWDLARHKILTFRDTFNDCLRVGIEGFQCLVGVFGDSFSVAPPIKIIPKD